MTTMLQRSVQTGCFGEATNISADCWYANKKFYLFKKFSGRPGRGHSIETSLPVEDRVI